MRILYLLIPMALGVVGVALWGFIWAVRSGQFDDLDTPSLDILHEERPPAPPTNASQEDDAG